MTEISRIHPGPRMSQAVVHGDLIWLAGQVGAPGGSVTAQTRAILAKIDALLAQTGSSKSRLLQATIWLASMDDLAEMNAAWDAWSDPENPPARACAESGFATPDYRVEIMVVAAR